MTAELLEFAASSAAAGQRQLANSMKQLVCAASCPTAERLDFTQDTPFLEPSLFSFFSREENSATLDQVLFGQLSGENRPAEIPVHIDRHGAISLPGLGMVRTELPPQPAVLRAGPAFSGLQIKVDGHMAPHTFEAVERVWGSGLEVDACEDELMARHLDDCDGRPAIGPDLARRHKQSLQRAAAALQQAAADWGQALLAVTRRVVLFEQPNFSSFAPTEAHGAVFLQPPAGADEVFFLEDLAHQCGHVLLNAAMVKRSHMFAVDPDLPLTELTGDSEDQRTLYAALHDAFVDCVMSICLERCLQRQIFSGRQEHELLGRLAHILRRLSLELMSLHHQGLFSSRGIRLIHLLGLVFDDVFERVEDRILPFDLSNQAGEFDYDGFRAANPPHPD